MKLISEKEDDLGLSTSFYTKSKLFPFSYWQLGPEELNSLSGLDELFFPFPWSKRAWFELGDNAESYLLGVLRNGPSECVAFSLWKISELEGLAHLLKVLVSPKWRGKGLGSFFLQSSLDYFLKGKLMNFYLEVEENNYSAIRIYERLGFEKLHTALNFYGTGRNAVKMGKFLE
tara:strand:+ start:993 stop:1514 length:522 start_codon:yes stop_codon:yes gene_type:complete